MTHHTPGPWTMRSGHYIGAPAYYIDPPESAPRSECVAVVMRSAHYHRSPAEDTANANLVVTAPEMLGVLERIVEIYDTLDWTAAGPLIVQEARAVIRKAKGEV